VTQDHLTKTVIKQWCLQFEHLTIIVKVLRYHWSYFNLLQCLGSVLRDTGATAKNSDQTVMRQWCNSDAFDLSNFMSYFILLQCLGGLISDTRPFDKNSDQTVMRQWSNSDVKVMEQWFLWFDFFNIISKFWDDIDHNFSFCNAFEVWLFICWWHKTIWQKQWSNSDETVMEQWCNSDANDFIFKLLRCQWSYFEVWLCILWWHKTFWQTQWSNSDATVMQQWCLLILALLCHLHSFEMLSLILYPVAMPWGCVWKIVSKHWWDSDGTVMEQWCNSDGTVMPLIWALSHYFQAFEMSLIIFYPFAMPWECVWRHKTFWQKQWRNSDATVIEQWLNSDAFDLSFLMLISRFLDVMDHIISFNNALEVWLLIWWWNKTFWQKTVM
jgi:hypothetical protein